MMKKNNHPNRDWRPKWKVENGIATHLPTGRAYTQDRTNEIIICKAEENPVSDDGKLYRQAKTIISVILNRAKRTGDSKHAALLVGLGRAAALELPRSACWLRWIPIYKF